MQQRRWVWIFLSITVIAFMAILFSLNRQQSTPDNSTPSEIASSEQQKHSNKKQPAKDVRANWISGKERATTETSEVASLPSEDFRESWRTSKGDRIARLHEKLRNAGVEVNDPVPEEIAIVTEGMDTLSAARFLIEHSISDYALEYAQRAVAENPDSFEAVLLWSQLLNSHEQNEEREAAFRLALEMNPNSIEALFGLGQTLSAGSHPWEAVPYLQQAVNMDSSASHAYAFLGISYEKVGMYDEALTAFQKAYEINQDQGALMHLRALEEGKPIFEPVPFVPQENPPGETFPGAPLQGEAPPTPAGTERLASETGPVEQPIIERGKGENKDADARYQQMMDEIQRISDELQWLIDQDSTPSFTDDKLIADLERSIVSNPNRSDSYLELARAYEKAGEHEKAASVYQHAMERFPKDKRIQREWEALRNK